jgi:hypothetical protein
MLKQASEPSPEEIRERCREIQQDWDVRDELLRRGLDPEMIVTDRDGFTQQHYSLPGTNALARMGQAATREATE